MNLTDTEAVNLAWWCARECERQEAGPRSVPDMMEAALFSHGRLITVGLIHDIGIAVVPTNRGFRRVPAHVGFKFAIPHDFILRALNALVAAWDASAVTPAEFYQEFERIHPFVDGNGRAGAILYNQLLGQPIGGYLTPPPFVS